MENNISGVPYENAKKISNSFVKTLFLTALVSLVFGLLGGVTGSLYIAKEGSARKFFGLNEQKKSVRTLLFEENSSIIDVVKKASPAVVSIVASKDVSKFQSYGFDPFSDDFFAPFFQAPRTPKPSQPNIQQVSSGSGFFISADGMIVTNKHVIDDSSASYTAITSDGKKYQAKVLVSDPRNDIALIKIEGKDFPFLSLADSSKIQIGQTVVAIGNSLGQYQNTVTTGIVSGIGRSITAGGIGESENLEGVIQTDAAINPGNSGGPLLNIAGQVIAINTAIDRQGQLVGFAIPSNDIQRAISSFQKNGKITRPYIGVRYVMLSKEVAAGQNLPKDYGALIVRGDTFSDFAVVPGSPADKAGLVENDIILEVDGKRLEDSYTLASAIKNKEAGDTVSLKIYHKGEEKTLSIKLEEVK